MPINDPSAPPNPRDGIEREPPGWGMLPIAVVVVVMGVVAFTWLLWRFAR